MGRARQTHSTTGESHADGSQLAMRNVLTISSSGQVTYNRDTPFPSWTLDFNYKVWIRLIVTYSQLALARICVFYRLTPSPRFSGASGKANEDHVGPILQIIILKGTLPTTRHTMKYNLLIQIHAFRFILYLLFLWSDMRLSLSI